VQDDDSIGLRWQSDTQSFFATSDPCIVTAGTDHEL